MVSTILGSCGEDALPPVGAVYRGGDDTSWDPPHPGGAPPQTVPMLGSGCRHPPGLHQENRNHRLHQGDDERSRCKTYFDLYSRITFKISNLDHHNQILPNIFIYRRALQC